MAFLGALHWNHPEENRLVTNRNSFLGVVSVIDLLAVEREVSAFRSPCRYHPVDNQSVTNKNGFPGVIAVISTKAVEKDKSDHPVLPFE